MWTRQLLKENGKIAFQRNYWTCVLVCVVSSALGNLVANFSGNPRASVRVEDLESFYEDFSAEAFLSYFDPRILLVGLLAVLLGFVLSLCFAIFVTNVLTVGTNRYFLENREHRVDFAQVFYGFREGRYLSNVWIMFLRVLYVWGWSLLFVIPGIVKAYSYMMVPYILAENTYLDRRRVFELSSEMMRGHKWEAFKLEVSFFGWFFLSAVTSGLVGIFYVNPYWSATFAEFYSAVKAEARMKGLYTSDELPGVFIQTDSTTF